MLVVVVVLVFFFFLIKTGEGKINLKRKAIIAVHELTFYLRAGEIKKSVREKSPREVGAGLGKHC